MFSSADPAAVRRNVAWVGEIPDMEMIRAVQNLLTPVKNQTWRY